MKKAFYILFLITSITSCVKERTSECFSGIRLQYRYVLNNQYKDLFHSSVNRINAYVFDEKGLLYGTYSDTQTKFSNNYVMNIPLQAGKYTIIAWGGAQQWKYSVGALYDDVFEPFLTKGKTTLEQFRLKINNFIETGQDFIFLAEQPDELYYGILKDIEVKQNQFSSIENIELMKNTNNISITITGLEYITGTKHKAIDILDVTCIAKNGLYTYQNLIAETARQIHYIPPHKEIESDALHVEMTVLRLIVASSPQLIISQPSTNDVLFSENIIEQILKSPQYKDQEDIDREDEYNFEISINKDTSIDVKVNGWQIEQISPAII